MGMEGKERGREKGNGLTSIIDCGSLQLFYGTRLPSDAAMLMSVMVTLRETSPRSR